MKHMMAEWLKFTTVALIGVFSLSNFWGEPNIQNVQSESNYSSVHVEEQQTKESKKDCKHSEDKEQQQDCLHER